MFRFRFEQVLNVRKLAEEQILQEFSEQVRGLERERERLRSIRGEKAAGLANHMRHRDGVPNAGETGLALGYLRSLRQGEVAQAVLDADRERALEAKRDELTEAMKRRKIMEILRQKKFAQYWKEWTRKESVELNEQGIIRFLKRSGDEKADHHL